MDLYVHLLFLITFLIFWQHYFYSGQLLTLDSKCQQVSSSLFTLLSDLLQPTLKLVRAGQCVSRYLQYIQCEACQR